MRQIYNSSFIPNILFSFQLLINYISPCNPEAFQPKFFPILQLYVFLQYYFSNPKQITYRKLEASSEVDSFVLKLLLLIFPIKEKPHMIHLIIFIFSLSLKFIWREKIIIKQILIMYQISYPGNPLNYKKSIYAHIFPAIPK